MKEHGPKIRTVLAGLAMAAVFAGDASAADDSDLLHVFCRAIDVDGGRVFYSEVFPVQRQRYYDQGSAYEIAFSSHVDARWGSSTGHPDRRGCWHEESALDARTQRDRQAAAERRKVQDSEPVFTHWRP